VLKKILFFFTAFSLVFVYQAYAASGTRFTVINYPIYESSTNLNFSVSTLTTLTDNNLGTSRVGYSAGSPRYWYNQFTTPKRMNGMTITPTTSTPNTAKFTLTMYDNSNNILGTVNSSNGNVVTDVDFPTVSGVYKFSLRCFDSAQACALAEVDLFEAPPDTTPPSGITGFTATAHDGYIYTFWDAATDNEAVSHYEIYRNNVKIAETPNTNYTHNGLTNGTTYLFKVRAVDASTNTGAFSDTISIYPKDNIPPYQPTGLAVAVSDYQATLTWAAHSGYTDFRLYKLYLDGAHVFTSPVGDATYLSHTFTGLTNGDTYTFGVSAVDTSFNEGNMGVKSAKVHGEPPPIPTGVSSTVTSDSATITWDSIVAPADFAGYNVYKNGVKVTPAPITATTYLASGLVSGTSYEFKVTSIDTHGNESDFSASTTALPYSPLDVTLIPNGTSIMVMIAPGTGSSPFTYTLSGLSGSFTSTKHLITGLTANTDYLVHIEDATGADFSMTINTGPFTGYTPPPEPALTGTIDTMLSGFGDINNVALIVIASAVGLFLLIVLSLFAWRLTKRKLRIGKPLQK
jgi:chitodextrinase